MSTQYTNLIYKIPPIPLIFATVLSVHGLRKKSLSPSGALAAFIVGFIMLSSQLKAYGVSMIVFYLVGSRATKMGKSIKVSYEEGHEEAGYRTATQVLCNSLTGFIATILWGVLFTKDYPLSEFLTSLIPLKSSPYSPSAWCPLSDAVGNGWSRFFVLLNLGHFACCLGDTLASELGILSSTPPILITTLKPVPPGTNGGMSVTGTLASIAGGTIMGITVAATLLLENSRCRQSWFQVVAELLLWGTLAGGIGSLLDSLMGATIQRTRYSADKKLILLDETKADANPKDIKVISGLNILSNNQVNLLSSFLTAILLAYIA